MVWACAHQGAQQVQIADRQLRRHLGRARPQRQLPKMHGHLQQAGGVSWLPSVQQDGAGQQPPTSEPGVNVRLTPAASMVTVRMQPPEEPSRAIACDTAACTKWRHSSALISGRHRLSHQPLM